MFLPSGVELSCCSVVIRSMCGTYVVTHRWHKTLRSTLPYTQMGVCVCPILERSFIELGVGNVRAREGHPEGRGGRRSSPKQRRKQCTGAPNSEERLTSGANAKPRGTSARAQYLWVFQMQMHCQCGSATVRCQQTGSWRKPMAACPDAACLGFADQTTDHSHDSMA